MVSILNRDGIMIHTSRNLRGILEHTRRVGTPDWAAIERRPAGRGQLYIKWADGSTVETGFESWSVLVMWVRARRSFHGARLLSEGREIGIVSKTMPA